jgi:hypothetical protein
MIMSGPTSQCSLFFSAAIVLVTLLRLETDSVASPLDQMTDLTGRVTPIIMLKGRHNFTSEYRYDIGVRNHTPDLLIADSLVVVLEKITNLAGEDHEALKNEPILSRFDVLGQDGETDEEKPYFRIPVGASPGLAAQTDSFPASVRIRNKDYLSIFNPVFRVYGKKRLPSEPKQQAAQPQPIRPDVKTVKLIQLLLKKGDITEEEWRKATQP